MADVVVERLEQHWREEHGLARWLRSVDHKEIGMRYIYTAFFFFAVAGASGAADAGAAGRTPTSAWWGPETYNELFTMHGITMIFCSSRRCCSASGTTSSRS